MSLFENSSFFDNFFTDSCVQMCEVDWCKTSSKSTPFTPLNINNLICFHIFRFTSYCCLNTKQKASLRRDLCGLKNGCILVGDCCDGARGGPPPPAIPSYYIKCHRCDLRTVSNPHCAIPVGKPFQHLHTVFT